MDLKHYDHDGRVRFITFCTHRRLPILTINRYRSIVAQSIDDVRKETGFRLFGYVIMPEHVHLVMLPADNMEVGRTVGEIKRRSAKKVHKLIKSSGTCLIKKLTITRDGREKFVLWQRRCYDHNCRSEESVWKKVMYCHNNPVTRGLVNDPGKWKWSSHNWYQGDQNEAIEIDISK
jgi:putative transposase